MYKNRYKRASTRIAKRNRIKRYVGIFFVISVTIALLIGFIFLVRADFLKVKNFEVLGSKVVSAEDIKSTANGFTYGNKFLFIPRSNIIFLNKGDLTKTLLSKFTRLEDVEVNKELFSKSIELKITERNGYFLWCSLADECFFMTNSGFVFEKALDMQKTKGLIIFRGILKGNPLLKNFATPDKMQNYSNFIGSLRKGGVEVSSIDMESSDKAIAKTNIGNIFFNPTEEDLLLVGENTVLLINEIQNKNSKAEINYIDARFGNKFYYKLY